MSGTGIEVVPNLTGEFGRVLEPYGTLPKTSVGSLPSTYPRFTLVRTPPDTLAQVAAAVLRPLIAVVCGCATAYICDVLPHRRFSYRTTGMYQQDQTFSGLISIYGAST